MTVGLLFRIEAKPGNEDDVARLLENELPDVFDQLSLTAGYAVRFVATTFGIVVTFDDDAGTDGAIGNHIAAWLRDSAQGLLLGTPTVEGFDVLAAVNGPLQQAQANHEERI